MHLHQKSPKITRDKEEKLLGLLGDILPIMLWQFLWKYVYVYIYMKLCHYVTMSLCDYVVKLHSDHWRPSSSFQTRRGTPPMFFPCPWGGSKWCSPAVPFPAHRLDEARPHSLAATQLAFKVAILQPSSYIKLMCKFQENDSSSSTSIYLMQLEMPNSGQSGRLKY